jgi:hypothetical protein
MVLHGHEVEADLLGEPGEPDDPVRLLGGGCQERAEQQVVAIVGHGVASTLPGRVVTASGSWLTNR